MTAPSSSHATLTICPSSGITIIKDEMPQARTVSFGLFVRSGAAHERANEAGASHFLEHLVFKGAVTDQREITEAMADLGSHVNAYTTDEHTSYYATCLPEVANETLELLLQLLHPKFTEEDVKVERSVVLEEMRQYRDDPSYLCLEKGLRFFAPRHALSKPIIGTEAALKKMSRDDIERFFYERYHPSRIALSVAGDVRGCQIEQLVATHGAHLKARNVVEARQTKLSDLKRRQGIQRLSKQGIHTSYLVAFWPGVSEHADDKFALELWCDIVGAGARFAWGLIEPGIVDAAGISCEPRIDTGYVMLSAEGSPDRLPFIETELARILAEVIAKPITEDELQQSKAMTLFSLASRDETPGDRMNGHGEHWLTHGVPYPLAEEQSAFERVTLEQVNACSQRFQLVDAAVTVVTPAT